jgi:hypothetical protein
MLSVCTELEPNESHILYDRKLNVNYSLVFSPLYTVQYETKETFTRLHALCTNAKP